VPPSAAGTIEGESRTNTPDTFFSSGVVVRDSPSIALAQQCWALNPTVVLTSLTPFETVEGAFMDLHGTSW
jgi:hypothetical protein